MGDKKPVDVDNYLHDFIDEMKILVENWTVIEDRVIGVNPFVPIKITSFLDCEEGYVIGKQLFEFRNRFENVLPRRNLNKSLLRKCIATLGIENVPAIHLKRFLIPTEFNLTLVFRNIFHC